MKLISPTLLAVALLTTASAVSAQQGPPDGSTPEQQAVIANDPPYRVPHLKLAGLPANGRGTQRLFDGRSLAGWDSWLGYADPRDTYGSPSGGPIGLNHDTTGVFRVVTEDGRPAIFTSGKIWGGLITKANYRNYHLHLQFKWGKNAWFPMPRNNGVLYHSHGAYGAFFGTWMSALEFEIVPKSVGMLLTVGDSKGTHSFQTVDWRVGANVSVARDRSIAYPFRRYMPGGRLSPIQMPAFNVDAAVDAERPLGEWNTLDIYTLGDRSIHVVNGTPVLAASGLSTTDEAGRRHPLTEGRIQLQSEGAETYLRDITLTPITRLPRILSVGGKK
ncbi:3-keto-disaccharide hydrolase [Novosphingobium olei]|uniref:DUF1080 domain-containing protein n=1 Tax=Novosphingobium olei TaxID=2728851 RepID=A0A7Y0G9J0_9SPHN|nr:DUF1080 domain-containing protein [Novosphingobium olei]NML92859.1 DUF1080 domain-containing protein [Novosphingobium olei]